MNKIDKIYQTADDRNKFGFDEVTSSAGDVQQDAVGILLTKGGMMDGTDSATARHEDEAKRNTNGTADVIDRKGFAETYTVEECCEILDSQRVPIKGSERSAGEYPYYGANGIQDYVDDYIFDDELVLLAEDGGNFGSKTRPIAYRVSGKCWVNNHAHVLKPKSMIDVDYLCYSLMFYDTNGLVNGATRQKLTQATMRKMKIPKITLEEQLKIVEKLKKVQGVITKKRKQLEGLDILIKARFVEMFGDPIQNEKGWDIVTFKDCLNSIENGKSFICEANVRTGNNPAILKLSAVTYGVYNPDENKAIINSEDFVEAAAVHSGDLLFTRKNTPELVGMAAYVSETPEKLMMPDLVFRLNTNNNCNKIFLWQLINHDRFRGKIKKIASGSAKSMSNISKERLGALEMYLPPMDLQNEFVAFVIQVDKLKVVETNARF